MPTLTETSVLKQGEIGGIFTTVKIACKMTRFLLFHLPCFLITMVLSEPEKAFIVQRALLGDQNVHLLACRIFSNFEFLRLQQKLMSTF